MQKQKNERSNTELITVVYGNRSVDEVKEIGNLYLKASKKNLKKSNDGSLKHDQSANLEQAKPSRIDYLQ
jgi:hypothetical protein